jgi:hypothetical protein
LLIAEFVHINFTFTHANDFRASPASVRRPRDAARATLIEGSKLRRHLMIFVSPNSLNGAAMRGARHKGDQIAPTDRRRLDNPNR